MRILFIHQGFPGQFVHLVRELKRREHEIWTITKKKDKSLSLKGINALYYNISRGNAENIHHLCREVESKTIRGEAVAQQAFKLRESNKNPDIIIGHPGWVEMLFLKDIWPDVPQIHYNEFFYGVKGTDNDFDGGIEDIGDQWIDKARARMKNAHILSGLNTMTRGISPTFFQQKLLPKWAQDITDVIHEGIDTEWLKPDESACLTVVNSNKKTIRLTTDSPVITFINRTFEPYRGIHIFLEAIKKLQKINSSAIVLLVGNDQPNVSYGKNRQDGLGWLSYLRKFHSNNLDWDRIFYIGQVPHSILRNVYQISAAHVYLSYPFVLSWSMLEAMSCGALVLASDTEPVREVITDKKNGLLVPFKDHEMLATMLNEAVNSRHRFQELRKNARNAIITNYKLDLCINKQIQIINSLA